MLTKVGALNVEEGDTFLLKILKRNLPELNWESGDWVVFPTVSADHKCQCKNRAVKIVGKPTK